MTLDELKNEIVPPEQAQFDACAMRIEDRMNKVRYPEKVRLRGGHLVLVENEEGTVEYKVLHPDGHLGAVEDC